MPRAAILPARFPPAGAWPAAMRADMAAAYLDFPDTRALAAAVVRGEAPPPSALRTIAGKREPMWARADLERFVAPSRERSEASHSRENLAALL